MRSKRQSRTAEADLTPMLDIVFFLLIFFIVTAIFIKESAINMTPPPPGAEPQAAQMPTILVRLGEDGLVRVNGELSDIGSVRARLERLLAEQPEQGVLVQAHPTTRNRLVILAVDQAYSAGVQNVGFAVDAS